MIERLEKELAAMKRDARNESIPKKYRNRAAQDFIRLQKDIDRIYKMHSKMRLAEEAIARKYGLEIY